MFEKCGKIWDLRLMMDPMTGLNRGYAFVTFCDRDGAHEGVKQVRHLNLLPNLLENILILIIRDNIEESLPEANYH